MAADDAADDVTLADLRIDLYPRNPDMLRARLRHDCERHLATAAERVPQLNEVLVRAGEYVAMLKQARELYVYAYDYACVAMCGITSERILKEMLARVRTRDGQGDQVSRLPARAVIRELRRRGVLTPAVAERAIQIADIRNLYAHGDGTKPPADAKRALDLLHELVAETVSMASGVTVDGWVGGP